MAVILSPVYTAAQVRASVKTIKGEKMSGELRGDFYQLPRFTIKNKKTNKKKTFSKNKVRSLVLTDEKGNRHKFEAIPIRALVKESKSILAEKIVEGPKISLYVFKGTITGPSSMDRLSPTPYTRYYVWKRGMKVAEDFMSDPVSMISENASFRKVANELFKDDEALLEKINNKEYKLDDIVEVVREFNTNAGEQVNIYEAFEQ